MSDANKLLIHRAWAGTPAFASAGYVSSWVSPSPPPPTPPPPSPPPPPYAFTSTATLKTAVQAYHANPTAATATYGPIADWDVSGITDMSYLFKDSKNFNADVSSWDTSGVTNMYQMFWGALAFNQPLSFDTSSVTSMGWMFYVRSSPYPAPNLQSSPPLRLACTAVARRRPASKTAARPAPRMPSV